MFSSLKVRVFRIYWAGMFISLIGSWIQTIAQSWLVFQLTNSAFLLGVAGFLGSIPIFVFSLLGGVLADRVNKRDILIFTQTAFMILAFILAGLTYFKLITPYQIMFIAFLNGLVMAFDAPSRQAMVIELVGKKHLANAIALNSVSFNSSRIIGPSLAGILVAAIGMSGCFFINAISFLAVIIALLAVRVENISRVNRDHSAFGDLKEGLLFMGRNRLILALVCMVGVSSLFGVPYMILMPIFANDILHVGVRGLGVLMSASGLGALAAALILARLGDFKYKGRLLVYSSILFSISLVLFSLSKSYLFSLVSLVFIGASSVMAMALINTILQTEVNDEFRGRVMSAFMFTFAGIMPFGNLIAGSLSQVIGAPLTIGICGFICLLFFLGINFLFPAIRRI